SDGQRQVDDVALAPDLDGKVAGAVGVEQAAQLFVAVQAFVVGGDEDVTDQQAGGFRHATGFDGFQLHTETTGVDVVGRQVSLDSFLEALRNRIFDAQRVAGQVAVLRHIGQIYLDGSTG